MKYLVLGAAASAVGLLFTSGAIADTVSPEFYENNTLEVGDSVTIRKTVVIEKTGPTDALLDVMFLFDTTGSMGSAIAGAKGAAANLLTGLSSLGDLASGAGFYGDPNFNGVVSDLSTTDSATVATINSFAAGVPDGGGDSAEQGNAGINDAALNASWRDGSNRFIIALGDAPFKDTPADSTVVSNLAAQGVELIGLNFGGGAFNSSVTELGGTAYTSGTSSDDILRTITDSITASFARYNRVTIDDLTNGAPFFDVATSCVSADIGTCVGADAVGDYDRSVDRTFEFDVTFTRTAAGDAEFDTYGLVDGGIIGSERDVFGMPVAPPPPPVIPLPAAGWMLLAGLGGLAGLRRIKR